MNADEWDETKQDGTRHAFVGNSQQNELNDLTHQIIGAAFEVSNEMGCGYLEKLYENSLMVEFARRGIPAESQSKLTVRYKGVVVGDYFADILVAGKVIVEIKCVDALINAHVAQCLNYLKGTGLTIALLFNFQKPKLQYKRIVRNF